MYLAVAIGCMLAALNWSIVARADDDQRERTTETGTPETDAPAIDASAIEPSDIDVAPLVLEPFHPRPLTSADLPPSSPLFRGSLPRSTMVFGSFGRDWRPGRNDYRGIVEREAQAQGLPPSLVDAIMAVESSYNPSVIGFDGEIGLMQVMLPTARMLGFSGTSAELANPETNIHFGARYLAGAWRLAGGDLCTAAMKYRAGHGETRFSYLSVDYCMRVRSHLTAHGVAVSGAVPLPTFGRSVATSISAPARSASLSASGAINLCLLYTSDAADE